MKQPVLVIMAAGMGSRYGGLKQIDPIGAHGEIIIDYSIYDAYKAGFRKVVCIIKKQIEKEFKETIGNRLSKVMDVSYAYQSIDDIPEGFEVPADRVKPWGTGHAILTCRDLIDSPFAVINADDYYGADAFKLIYDFLSHAEDKAQYDYAMIGYILENTLTDNGHVARGICSVDDGKLVNICERTHIEKHGNKTEYTEDDGKSWHVIPEGSTVSMNLWGFTPSIMKELKAEFPAALTKILKENPIKGEYFLPTVVNDLLKTGKAEASVFRSSDRWYGVTYRQDKPVVVKAIRDMTAAGKYPEKLWGKTV